MLPAYVVTSPYTSMQVPLATRPAVSVLPNVFYEAPRTQVVYATATDSLISQQTSLNATTDKKDERIALLETVPTAYIQPAPQVVYTSVVGDLISQQSLLNAERKVDEKINRTVHEQIQRYELEKLREEDYKRRLAEYEARREHGHHHHHHHGENHHHHEDHHHHHHQHVIERTQGSQTDLSLTGLSIKDDKCCCESTTSHKLPVCDSCVCSHSDCCLEEKIRRIRHELHLPDEKSTTHDHREVVTPDKPKVTFTNKKYECQIAEIDRPSRSRSRSKTANSLDRPKSRSPSANSRPLWRPTGANDYTWTHQTRSDIINGVYRPKSGYIYQPAPIVSKPRSSSSDKANQTCLPTSTGEVTFVYPTKTYSHHEYHEIPVHVDKSYSKNVIRSRSNSKHRSCSPVWRSTNKNDYSWTSHTLNNYDNYCSDSSTKTTVVHKDQKYGQPRAEVFYTYETIRPRTSVDHFYGTNNSNNTHTYYQTFDNRPKQQHTDYYYYETTKPLQIKKTSCEKSTSTSLRNAIGTQTYADKGASTALQYSRDQNNKYNVYIK